MLLKQYDIERLSIGAFGLNDCNLTVFETSVVDNNKISTDIKEYERYFIIDFEALQDSWGLIQ